MKIDQTKIVSFVLSFSVTTIFLVYFLKLPFFITGDKNIVNEYYGENFSKFVPLDMFFIAIYFLVAMYLMKKFKTKKFSERLLTVVITTAVLTGGFCYYFNSKPKTDQFFSRWSHSVKYTSVVYDVLLLGFNYYLFEFLLKFPKDKVIV